MKTLEELPVSDVLEGRIREDNNLGRPFEAASRYAQSGVPGRLTVHMDILNGPLERVTADFGIADPPSTIATVPAGLELGNARDHNQPSTHAPKK